MMMFINSSPNNERIMQKNITTKMRMNTSGNGIVLLVMLFYLNLNAGNPNWQIAISGGYGISTPEDKLGVGFSKSASVTNDSGSVDFYQKQGTLGNGIKADVNVSKYMNRNVGMLIGIGVSMLGANKIDKTIDDIKYSNEYKSSYFYLNIGPKFRSQFKRTFLYSSIGIGLFYPFSTSYVSRIIYTDRYMNPYNQDIEVTDYKLKYNKAIGAVALLGMEYKIKRRITINMETTGHFFCSREERQLYEWKGSPDRASSEWGNAPGGEWPNSFNNIALKIGLSFLLEK